jgi:ribosomal protein S2
MKLKKIKHKKYKVLKLHLLKSQVYLKKIKNDHFDDFLNKILEQSELHVKKAFKIIYEYHCNGYSILFVGLPALKDKSFNTLFKHTQHSFIPSNIWINGLIANRFSIFRYLELKRLNNKLFNKENLSLKNINTLLNIKTKPNLIVIFDSDIESDMIKEFYNLDIPVILFGSNMYDDFQITYKIPGNFFFVTKKVRNIINFLLHSIIKRPFKKRSKNLSRFSRKKV